MSTAKKLEAIARRLSSVEEGVACAGTKLESRTFKAGGKAFLFVGADHARLKLGASLEEAQELARSQPELYAAGAGGWVKVSLGGEVAPPARLLAKWVKESHGLLAKKKRP